MNIAAKGIQRLSFPAVSIRAYRVITEVITLDIQITRAQAEVNGQLPSGGST
jgi:hypothetical protein